MTKKILFFICTIFIGFLIFGHLTSCKPKINDSGKPFDKYPHVDKNWIDWNIAIADNPGVSSSELIAELETFFNNWVAQRNPNAHLQFNLKHCPCDPLLTNINATITYGSGNTVPPPPPVPKPLPNGDYTIGTNFKVYNPEFKENKYYPDSILYKSPKTFATLPAATHSRKVLAVIDTGLDTLRFQESYANSIWLGDLLWQEADAKKTLFNVVVGEDEHRLIDNTNVKHGTDVTAIVLTQLSEIDANNFPKIMSIRAFDQLEQGSIYTVSCALSYAIQQHADFINASWGYFGKADSVLFKYLVKASDQNIRIIAAAGNTPFQHDPAKICSPLPDKLNFLDRLRTKDSLFYPAAFAPIITNLVSVTQLHQVTASNPHKLFACYYQNFSNKYITVGAYERTPTGQCCTFQMAFLSQPIEGSSFATPVLTAKLMKELTSTSQDIKKYIDVHLPKEEDKRFTLNGNYYEFKQFR